MKRYTIRAYYRTGFDYINIPLNAGVIRSHYTPVTFPECVLLQNKGLAQIKINTTWEDIQDADYIEVVNGSQSLWYWVMDIEMKNENMCVLSLLMDGLTSIGIENITFEGGWLKRVHTSNDTLFDNDIDEPFQPRSPLVIDGSKIIDLKDSPDQSKFTTIIATTADISAFDVTKAEAVQYVDTSGASTVTVPSIPPPVVDGTVTRIQNSLPGMTNWISDAQLPNTQLYSYTPSTEKDLKKRIQALRSLGLDGIISASYQIPTSIAGISTSQTKPGFIPDITSNVKQFPPSGITNNFYPFRWNDGNYTPKNNKAYMGKYNRYTIVNMVSGEKAEYLAEEIYQNGDTSPYFIYWGDPAPEGRPFARPKSLRGNTSDIFLGATAGEKWQNSPIVYSESSGSYIANATLNYARQTAYRTETGNVENYQTQLEVSGVSKIMSTVSSVMAGKDLSGNATDIYGWVRNEDQSLKNLNRGIDQTRQNIQQMAFNTMVQTHLVIPEVNFPRSTSLQNYLGNSFYIYRTRLSHRDFVYFDLFLNMYGYAVDEPLTASSIDRRKYFTFVLARDVALNCRLPMYMRNRAKQQLESGVRIWKTVPSLERMYGENPVNTNQ